MSRERRPILVLIWIAALGAGLHAGEAVRLRATQSLYADGQEIGLSAPGDVACGVSGVWVADTGNGRLVGFEATADGYLPTTVLAVPEVARPQRIQTAPDGSIYVLDGKQRRIGRVDRSGEFLGWVDPAGQSGAARVVVRGFDVAADGKLYVLDVASARVLVTDSAGTVERQIAFPDPFGFISDVAVDSRGVVFALDSVGRRLFRAAPDAEQLTPLTEAMTEEMDFPTNLTVDGAGRLFVSDRHGGGIVIVDVTGSFRGRQSSMGWKTGMLRYPAGLCVNGKGELFVADRGNSRLQVFRIVE
jgi:streptogramin lyase